jgi:hypothetical protein
LNPPAFPPAADPARRTGLLPFYASQPERRTRPWVIAVLGLFSAICISWLTCKLSRSHTVFSTPTIFLHSAEYVTLAALAGAAAIFLNVRAAAQPTDIPRSTIARTLAAGWVYAPCVTLLYWESSPWMLFAMALATLSTAFGLSRLFPHPAGPAPTHFADHPALPSLHGLPPADSPFNLALVAALCAQASLICLITARPALALLLLAITVFLPAWRWCALDSTTADWWLGRRTPLAHAALAILITASALLWGNGSARSPGRSGTAATNPTTPKPNPQAEDQPSSGYYGIILWPPPKKTEMVDPVLEPSSSDTGKMTKPLLIPFDGPYWFFKAPNHAPSPQAHVAHGNPTDVNIRSTNWSPLIMEAHQTLSQPIDLDCCSEIDVALTNADTRTGEIAIALLLTDSTAVTKPQLFVGESPIPSSQLDPIPQDRAPVKETLHFNLPANPTLHRFNQITVVFLPSQERARNAAKVSIDSFELIPRL